MVTRPKPSNFLIKVNNPSYESVQERLIEFGHSFPGKEAGLKMEAAHKKAAQVILKRNNEGHGDNYLDLHGLLLEEAMTAVKERFVGSWNSASNNILYYVIFYIILYFMFNTMQTRFTQE